MMKILVRLALLISVIFIPLQVFSYTMEELPIQDGGRIKPFKTFSEETLQMIYGKTKFEGQDAMRILSTWILVPDIWVEKDIIVIDHHGLKETLAFDKTKKRFALKTLMEHPRLNTLFSDVSSRLSRNEKLDPYYQAIQRLEIQMMTFLGVQKGAIRVFPPADPEKSTAWLAIAELEQGQKESFFKILAAYAKTFTSADGMGTDQSQNELSAAIAAFTSEAKAVGGATYPPASKMATEVHYQKSKPFLWTWILYLIAALLIGLSYVFAEKILLNMGLFSLFAAFLLHTYGFALRVYITERPPVSNMYETVIWVAWGTILFSGIFYFVRKKRYLLISGAIVAVVCMIVADRAPVILNPSLQPLEPVLRSNMWLIIHVMTITLSYAAFFLAMGVGDYGLFLAVRDMQGNKAKIRELAQSCYRILQVGVVLLAAGTILGGVWADYSWGRFWGWDPKETWAFIALMGYLALLHGRLTGWVKDVGTLAGSVVAFSLVIMAWYGVNYVLGTGLHSYGFGAGGIEYVASFVGLHLVFVGYAVAITLPKSPKTT